MAAGHCGKVEPSSVIHGCSLHLSLSFYLSLVSLHQSTYLSIFYLFIFAFILPYLVSYLIFFSYCPILLLLFSKNILPLFLTHVLHSFLFPLIPFPLHPLFFSTALFLLYMMNSPVSERRSCEIPANFFLPHYRPLPPIPPSIFICVIYNAKTI